VKKHPTFAPAHASLASTYAGSSLMFPVVGGFAMSPEEAYRVARPAALRAIDLDPLLAEAHAAMGYVHALERDWAAAEASFRHALSQNPALTTIYTDFVLSTLFPEGKLNEALLLLQAALRSDPKSLDVRRVMASIQLSAGLYDQALDNCRYVLAVNPSFPVMDTECGRVEVQKGDIASGIAKFEKRGDAAAAWIGYAYATSGRRAEAEDLLKRKAVFPQQQAIIYAGLGDKDRAFEAIERLAAINPGRAGFFLTFPELALLRDDPRVATLRKRLGLP